jgi:hypothetical protein
VAWSALRVPGPPPGYGLTADEIAHPDAAVRFARRTVQTLNCDGPEGQDTLALVDKAAPHALYDLMLTEVSPDLKSTALDVTPATGRTLWRTGANFVRFCADPDRARDHGLEGGELRLVINCDPHTLDRESVQAAKQFHLHLLYWTRAELDALAGAAPLGAGGGVDPRLRRQALDPISFLGGRLLTEALAGLERRIPGARVLPADEDAILRGSRPFGWVMALPGWGVLESPAFETLVRELHRALVDLAARLGETFTGHPEPPMPWTRHRLLPPARLGARIDVLPYSDGVRGGLHALAETLRDLPTRCSRRLARGSAATRMHLMTLNLPSYALALHAPDPGWSAAPVWLSVQPRLFSGIGGAGLLSLGGVPSVRVLRGRGVYDEGQWQARARFQRALARYNQARIQGSEPGLRLHDPNRFAGAVQGWIGG